MKNCLLIIVLLMLLFPSAAAATDGFDLGANMVKDGFMAFLGALGDTAFSSVGVNGSQQSLDAYVRLATFTFDPFSFPKIKELNFISAVIAFLLIVLYLGAGMGWAVICRVSPSAAMTISEITDVDRDIAGKTYFINIATCVFFLVFGYAVIRLILMINYVLTGLVAQFTVIEIVSPSGNVLLYLFSGVVFLVNVLFYVWRLIVICAVASFALILAAMLIWGYTRGIAIEILKYFIAVTFLQLIIVMIIAAAMIAIDVMLSFPTEVLISAENIPALILATILLMTIAVAGYICLKPFIVPVVKIIIKKVV